MSFGSVAGYSFTAIDTSPNATAPFQIDRIGGPASPCRAISHRPPDPDRGDHRRRPAEARRPAWRDDPRHRPWLGEWGSPAPWRPTRLFLLPHHRDVGAREDASNVRSSYRLERYVRDRKGVR